MKNPSYYDSLQVLLLQLGDNGRAEALLGEAATRAAEACKPFMVGAEFPSVYLELPLLGDPFLDVTLLYSKLDPGTRFDSPAAQGTEAVVDFFMEAYREHDNISFGFELDTSKSQLPRAAVHFQPRKLTQLVEPFLQAAGEPERAQLYLGQNARMPEGWPLSFFGMFRGRADTPLRVCGYMDDAQKQACATHPAQLQAAFEAIGFRAFDQAMLAQASQVMAAAPGTVDFQFDVLPDGSLSKVFALDVQFEIAQPEAVQCSFEEGKVAGLMTLLEEMGIADERWHQAIQATFARGLPAQRSDGSWGNYCFTLMPQWLKVRWIDGAVQPSKIYFLGKAGFSEDKAEGKGGSTADEDAERA